MVIKQRGLEMCFEERKRRTVTKRLGGCFSKLYSLLISEKLSTADFVYSSKLKRGICEFSAKMGGLVSH